MMRHSTIVIFIAAFCCLYACVSHHENSNDSKVHIKGIKPEEPKNEAIDLSKYIIKQIHLDEPQIELVLLKFELKDGPIKISCRTFAFGPDSLMTRVTNLGPDPFAPEFAASFILLAPDTITVDLQDVKRPETNPVRLFRGYLDKGKYRLKIKKTNLPASIYSFQCTVGNITKSRLEGFNR